MTPNDTGSCEWLAAEIALSHLADRAAVDPILAAFQADNPYADATAFAEHLVKLGYLTTFQATRLLEGQGRGLVLGPYVLVDVLGTGSMGAVYKALGKADRKPYAVKVLPIRSPWNVRLARKKMQQLPDEPHPAVVPWLDVGTSAGLHYLVWPFAEGETLAAAVRREGLLSPARAAAIGVQLAHALGWFERHGVWHGAIQPSNVMLGPDGQARLLDLGVGVLLAGVEDESLVDTLAETSGLAALLDCTAPECVTDPAARSIRGDQYGLGCTLYYGLTGRYPFSGHTAAEKMLAHQKEEPTPVAVLNPGVPAPLAAAIDRLLQKAPEARYLHTDELVAALTPLARQSTVYVPPPTPAPGSLRGLVPPGPTVTPMKPSASLLAAVTPRPSGVQGPTGTPTPRTLRSSGANLPLGPPRDVGPPSDPALGSVRSGLKPPSAPAPKPSADAIPPTPPARLSPWERLRRAVMFWKSWADPIACTLLTPSGLLPGETTTIQVVVHHTDRAEQARTLPDWRGTLVVPDAVVRGGSIGLNLFLDHVDVPKPLTAVEWHGFSAAALFTVRVPADWPLGQPVHGTLTVGREGQPVGKLEFAVPVAAGQPVG